MTCGNMNHLNHWYINHLTIWRQNQKLKHCLPKGRFTKMAEHLDIENPHTNLTLSFVPYLQFSLKSPSTTKLRPQNSSSAIQLFLVCYASDSEEESLAVSAPRYFLSKPHNLPRQDSGKKVSRILKVQRLILGNGDIANLETLEKLHHIRMFLNFLLHLVLTK